METQLPRPTNIELAHRNRRLGWIVGGLVTGMVGLSYLSVPLYELFCDVTGWSGTPSKFIAGDRMPIVSSEESSEVLTDIKRKFQVQFDANTQSGLNWSFQPVAREIPTELGKQYLAYYRAENHSDKPTTGTATFNVTPLKLGRYFVKVDCFCFTEQTLQPRQSVDMPVSFFIDPAIMDDPELDDVQRVTLSYTFYPYEDNEM